MNEKLEKLNQTIEKGEQKLRRLEHEEKMLQHQAKQLTRNERTHRLCTRGAALESYLPHPELVTDEQVSLLLKLLFRQSENRKIMEQVLAGESEKPYKTTRLKRRRWLPERQAGAFPSERGRNYTPPERWCVASCRKPLAGS